jgi:hypothetical protein
MIRPSEKIPIFIFGYCSDWRCGGGMNSEKACQRWRRRRQRLKVRERGVVEGIRADRERERERILCALREKRLDGVVLCV